MEYSKVDPAFGWWLSGYLDGEAHFGSNMYTRTRKSGYVGREVIRCMIVNARADDYPMLLSCQVHTGVGKLNFVPEKGKSRPNWRWSVASLEGSLRLIEILDQYPMRSKKKKDYEIWREITFLHATFKHPGKGLNTNDWERMAKLSADLRAVRAYSDIHEVV